MWTESEKHNTWGESNKIKQERTKLKHHTLIYSPDNNMINCNQWVLKMFFLLCVLLHKNAISNPSVCILLIVYTTHWPYFGVKSFILFSNPPLLVSHAVIVLLWQSLGNRCSIVTGLTCMVLQLPIKNRVIDCTTGEVYVTECVL